MLAIEQLSKSYLDAGKTIKILSDLNLSLDKGESISIQGASGSGKSTLLHLLAALDKPDHGRIFVGNKQKEDIVQFSEAKADKYRQTKIGMIFQRFNLIDCISVEDNVYLPAKINRQIPDSTHQEYLSHLMHSLGVYKHRNKQPNQLSGGEQQRVAIARALSHKPELLLADEPTGNLDENNSEKVSRLLVDTCKANNTSLIMVTHSEKVASRTQRQYWLESGNLLERV